jgi:hypothetical protein
MLLKIRLGYMSFYLRHMKPTLVVEDVTRCDKTIHKNGEAAYKDQIKLRYGLVSRLKIRRSEICGVALVVFNSHS